SANPAALTKKIERALMKELGYPVAVILRTLSELEALISREPFKKFSKLSDVMLNAVFLKGEPKRRPKMPFWSESENLEIIKVTNGVAFVVSWRKKNGWFGFPNGVVEKQLAVVATTRQWKTVKKIVLAAENRKC